MDTLTIAVADRDAVTVLTLHGAATAANVLRLDMALSGPLHKPRPSIVLDLTAVTALDCTAITMLGVAAAIARDGGGEVRIAAPGTSVRRALRGAGTMAEIATYGSLDGALAGNPSDLLARPDDVVNPSRRVPQQSVRPPAPASSRAAY